MAKAKAAVGKPDPASGKAQMKVLLQRRRYIVMRIDVLRAEIAEMASQRKTLLERLRAGGPMTGSARTDLRSKYVYALERHKDAREEFRAIAAENKTISERLKAGSAGR